MKQRSVRKAHITNEILVRLPVGPDRIRRKAVIGVSQGDTGRDDLVFRNIGNFAYDIRAHDSLSVDDRSQAAIPRGQHDAVAERAEIEVR